MVKKMERYGSSEQVVSELRDSLAIWDHTVTRHPPNTSEPTAL